MDYNFLPHDQDQEHLLPRSLHDWVEAESLERFVSDLIDQFDAEGRLDLFHAPYREDGWGHPAYHPRLLLKVLVFTPWLEEDPSALCFLRVAIPEHEC